MKKIKRTVMLSLSKHTLSAAKSLLIALFVTLSLSNGYAQTGDIRARRVIADQAIQLRGTRIDSIQRDTTGWATKTSSVPTAKAVYDFVKANAPVTDTNNLFLRIDKKLTKDLTDVNTLNEFCDTCWVPVVKGATNYKVRGNSFGWGVNGSVGLTKDNFLGHLDSVPLVFKINGKRQLYISAPFDTTWYEGRGAVQDILIGDYAGGRHRDTVNGRIAIGDSALASFNLSSKWGPSPIAIGTGNMKRAVTSDGVTSVGKLTLSNHPNPYRISAFGDAAAIGALSGAYSAYFGTFAGEYATGFSGQTFIGVNNGRSGGGENDCFIGGATGYFSGGYVTGATVTNGGSGYTVATVTFSQAKLRSFGYDFRTTPTGTAVIEDGIITGIIMTQYGKGYNNTEPCIVTITGDGVGATAEAVIDFSGYNTFSGALAGYSNGWGKYNTHNGWSAGYNGQRDTGTTTIGAQANRLSSIPQSTVIKNATAIGYKSIFSQNNTIILGDTSIRTSVGIGTTQPAALLDIKSSVGYGFKLSDGREGNYKVLNSDANGNAFWAKSPFITNDGGKIRLPNGAKKHSDSTLIYISVPDADFTSASSYARTPKYTALRFATKDTGAVSVNHPYISFGRHLGQGIMLYDQLSDSVSCMGIGVASYSLQSYIGNIGGHSFTWNWGGYREDLSNELMRLTNTGRLGIGTNTPTKVLDINSNSLRLRTAKTPSSATDAGEVGEIAWDENYIYVCVATNTWKRTALSTW